jgi:hypothetical protein
MYLVNQREVRPIDHQQYTTKLQFALFFLLKWYLSIINYLVQYYELHVLVDLQYSQLIEITPNIISTTYFTMKYYLKCEIITHQISLIGVHDSEMWHQLRHQSFYLLPFPLLLMKIGEEMTKIFLRLLHH